MACDPELAWSEWHIAALRMMWSEGDSASVIGVKLGRSRSAVLGKAHRLGLPRRAPTPARFSGISVARAVKVKPPKPEPKPFVMPALQPGQSNTDPGYRSRLPKLPEMTKNQLRAMLAEAARNTAEMGS